MRKSVDLVGKCVFLLILVFSLGGCGTSVEETSQYTAVIDAGSSGSRIYLYRVEDRGAGKVPNLIQTGNIKVEPGLSSYAANPQQAGESLLPLIDYALQHLPSGVQESTTLHLFATAGMRELSEDSRNSVMAAVRIYLEANTPFIFDGATDAMTIAGAYEGLYGWMAVNYIQDQFDPAGDREGIMEMGVPRPRSPFCRMMVVQELYIANSTAKNMSSIPKVFWALGRTPYFKRFWVWIHSIPMIMKGRSIPHV